MIKGMSTSKSTPTSPVTPKLPPPIPSSCLSAIPSSKTSSKLHQTTTVPNKSQFRHTILWNNILSHLRQTLIENNNTSRLRKQHSRFASGMVGGMLLINSLQNWRNTTTTNLNTNANKFDNIYFNGSQCVDIVYNYLTSSDQTYKFERKVTRDKVTKLCQMIMDSGVFEPISRSSSHRFDDTSLKYYRFKQDYLNDLAKAEEQLKCQIKTEENKTTLKEDNIPKTPIKKDSKEDKENIKNQSTPAQKQNLLDENQQLQQSNKSSSTYSKAVKSCQNIKSNNTKLKRKLTSMRRSTTMQTLLQLQDANNSNKNAVSDTDGIKQKENTVKDIKNFKELHPLSPNTNKNQTKKTPYSTSNFNLNDLKYVCTEKSDVKFNIEINKTIKSSIDSSLACNTLNKPSAQEIIQTRQITRELIIEKLLSLIDLPIIENLLTLDESINSTNTPVSSMSNDQKPKLINSNGNQNSNVSTTSPSLAILNSIYDLSKYDVKEEWRKCVLDCLDFIDWQKFVKNNDYKDSQNDKNLKLVLMKDIELYNLIKDYYVNRQRLNHFFLDSSFQPLFVNILTFIRKSHYSKALDILNLSTLLLSRHSQAELKRLLRFLYLTANSTHAPRLCETKPNNSILLNDFASCLISHKLIGFEESRLLLNFMLNNFDHLFRMNKSIEDSINRRKFLMQKYGHEEPVLEKLFCKRQTNQEYVESSKELTQKSLIDLINHIIDDPQISLKQKKLKLKALQRIHPDIYENNFSNLF